MKILHVIQQMAASNGGPSRGLATLAQAQADRGHDVAVLAVQKTSGEYTIDPGQYENLRVIEPPSMSCAVFYDGSVKRAIDQAARDRDLIHIHGMWRYFLTASADAARKYGIPYIIRPAGSLGRIPRRHKGLIKLAHFWWREQPVFRRAAGLQVCSKKELEELQELNLGVRTFIAPQPIRQGLRSCTPDTHRLRQLCPGLRDDRKLILYLGRISFIKKLDVLAEAFIRLSKRFPEWQLMIAGPHEDLEIVRKIHTSLARAGLANQLFMPGLVTHELKAACFAAASVFAQPSSHENFGMSVAEALLFGLPCVVSTGVALAQDISEGGAGIATESSVGTFESALGTLMAGGELWNRYSAGAEALSRAYSADVVVSGLDLEYQRCHEDYHTSKLCPT